MGNIKIIFATEQKVCSLLPFNPHLKEDITMLLLSKINKEHTFLALDGNTIAGAMSYTIHNHFRDETITVGQEQFKCHQPVNYLEFIQVSPHYQNRGIAKKLLDNMFSITAQSNHAVRVSRIVLNGEKLINTYKILAQEYQVDTFFYHADNIEPINFHLEKIENKKRKKFILF